MSSKNIRDKDFNITFHIFSRKQMKNKYALTQI